MIKKRYIWGMDNLTVYMISIMVLAPVYSAVSCGMVVGLSLQDCLSREERDLKRILLVYLSVSATGWLVTFCYQFYPSLFVQLNVVCLLCFVLPSIFFYRIVRFLTRLGEPEEFPPLHYLVPGLLALAMLVWSCFVPFDVRLEIVRGKAEVIPAGYEWYTRFFTLKPLLRVVFGLLYYILTLALLVSYYKRARGKDTLVRGPACWVIFLVGVSIASLLSSVLPTFMPRSRFYHSIWTAAVSCGIALQHVLLSYHVIRREYCLYVLRRESPPSSSGETDAGDVRLRRSHSGKLTQRRFERFFREHKPFLRPGYKMTDLVEDLDVNRTVLSAFINQTYGMNFNRYLNRFRLRELDRLRLRPANQGKSVSSLIGQVCAMVCMVMMSLDACRYGRGGQERRLRALLALTYLVTSLGWLGLVLYSVAPCAFSYYHPVFLLTLMLDQVMFFWVVSMITDTGERRRLNRWHWVVPVFLMGALFEGGILVSLVFFIYNTLYPALNLRNIYRYRRFIVDYSSEAQRISLDWLAAVQVFILVCVPVPLAGLLLDMETFSSSYFVWLGVLPTFVFYMMLCYNMLDKNYLIVQPEALKTEDMPPDLPALDRKRLERYLREKKPYLDPKLRITDLAAGLSTNRSYLSAFINKEYGMNFCRLINRCRLMALDRLRVSPANAGKTNMELVLMAGFSGYRNYLRVKKEEDRLALLKVFER